MRKRQQLTLGLMICLAFVGAAIYRWQAARVAAERLDDTDYAELYAEISASGQPAVLFFTASEGCCAGAVEPLHTVQGTVDQTVQDFLGRLTYISVDIGRLSGTAAQQVMAICMEHGILEIPAVLILNDAGQRHALLVGETTPAELREQLRQVVR